MGSRGPIPFPSAVKEKRGTLKPSREVASQPTIDPALPPRPANLEGDAAGQWDTLAPVLFAAGLLTHADAAALARLCSYRALLTDLIAKLKPGNLTQLTTGGESQSGDVKVAFALEEKVKALEDRFGLNPAARCRISVPKSGDGPQIDPQDFS